MSEQAVSDVALTARILGAAFYYPPSEIVQITELLSSGEWVAEWPYGDDAQKQAAAQKLNLVVTGEETLAQAYQRLFIGPQALPASPWGSVWLDKEQVLFGDSTVVLREWMRAHQVDIALSQNEPEDHIGLLLMMAAWTAENRPDALNSLLAEHLLPWARFYLARMQEKCGSPFYEGLSALTALTLSGWQDALLVIPAEKTIFA
ncbi:Tat proofreading chaperone DmsD [Morganella morganii]|nr:Tat proofreading chaperone DmsD [Morganella morganii]